MRYILSIVVICMVLMESCSSTKTASLSSIEGMRITTLDSHKMNLYINGNSEKKIVLLSGLGTPSPYIDYLKLSDILSEKFTVITVENFGYGYSDIYKKERSSQNIIEETRQALKQSGINPPYIIVCHSISGIYALWYANNYPKEIEAIIGIDSSVPEQSKYLGKSKKKLFNELLWSLGITRFENIINPGLFDHPLYKKGILSKDENKIYKSMLFRNYQNWDITNESEMSFKNEQSIIGAVFPQDIPVTFVLSDQTEAESKKMNLPNDWVEMHKLIIPGNIYGKIRVLTGSHYIHWQNEIEILNIIENIISK
jgi:pimeloyl-ACP methyl ester carboxylesterase